MKEFSIYLHSFQELREFTVLASVQPFRVLVGNDHQLVNGKGFIGMVSLDCDGPLKVRCDCDNESLLAFQNQASRFLV